MQGLKLLADIIDAINEKVGRGVSWVTTLLVVVVFCDVVMRYAFSISFVFTQELEWHLFAFVFLMGAGYTLLHDGHVRVDIIYQRLSIRSQAWLNAILCLLFMFPGCFLIIYTSIPWVIESAKILEGSPDPGGIPLRFILKSTVPLGFFLFGLQGVSFFIRNILIISGHSDGSDLARGGAH